MGEVKMEKRAYLLIMAGAILWGIIGFFVRGLYAFGFSPLQVVSLRVFAAALIMIVYLFFTRPELLKIRFRDSLYFVGTGICSLAFFNFCYFTTMKETSIAVAVILLYTAPAFVAVLSRIFFGEKLGAKKVFSLGLTFAGCAFVTGYLPSFGASSSFSLSGLGLLTGIGSGLGYALYSIFGKAALEKYHTMTITTYTFVFASLALLPVSGLGTMAGIFTSGSFWLYLLGLGLFPTVFAYLLYTKGLEEVESSRASIVATVEPVVGTLVGVFFFEEMLSSWQFAGVLLVLVAVVLIQERK
jgi:drug/metabolite transporter (DMT)-like permease